jgi:YVTN family beta-propeller protein
VRLRTIATTAASAVLLTAGVLAGAAPASAAGVVGETTTPLALPGHADMLVHPSRGAVYVAGGDSIVVTNAVGTPVRRIARQTGVSGLALSPNGRRLYAALRGANAVSVINTATNREVRRFSVGTACPGDVAWAVGRVWFSSSCTEGYDGSVNALDPQTGAVTTYATGLPTAQGAPLLAVSEREGWGVRLIAAARDLSGSELRVYDITTGAPDPMCWGPGPCEGRVRGIVQDLAVTASGADLVLASQATLHPQVSVLGLAEIDTYPTGPQPRAVAVAADGRLALGSKSPRSADLDLFGYTEHVDQPDWTHDFGNRVTDTNDLAPRGLAWSSDGTRLYAVVTAADGTSPVLHVLLVQP